MDGDDPLMGFSELALATGGDLLAGGATGFSSVCVDSRAASPGALFVALPGGSRDGHDFVAEAFSRGASAALVERRKGRPLGILDLAQRLGRTAVVVDDTLRGVQDAAGAYLRRFPGLLKVGITGSSGKTTTKEMTAAIVGRERSAVASAGNLNSDVGLPLSVFAVRKGHEVGVFEMGMNRKGEMAELASVLNPDVALITNVGSAHAGAVGGARAVAEEKKAIFSRMGENGVALIPEDSAFGDFLAEGVRGRVSFYGERSLAGYGGARDLGLDGSEITWMGERVRLALPGRHNLANALAAIAIAREVGASDGAIKEGIESARPMFGRGEILRGKVTVIRDCYNSNPESLAEAIGFCDGVSWPGRRVYVIGEMLELGALSEPAHEEMGRLLARSRADVVCLFGRETSRSAAAAESMVAGSGGGRPRFFHTCDMDELARVAGAHVRDGDLVLLKGSRGCALERLGFLFGKEGE